MFLIRQTVAKIIYKTEDKVPEHHEWQDRTWTEQYIFLSVSSFVDWVQSSLLKQSELYVIVVY